MVTWFYPVVSAVCSAVAITMVAAGATGGGESIGGDTLVPIGIASMVFVFLAALIWRMAGERREWQMRIEMLEKWREDLERQTAQAAEQFAKIDARVTAIHLEMRHLDDTMSDMTPPPEA